MEQSEVIALAGWPPETIAYAYAMYSRSALSIRDSIRRITAEKSARFFESYYFSFGHASIADNAHIPIALERIPEIAAFEVEDEQLWDGQERSTRYQIFEGGPIGCFTPISIMRTSLAGDFSAVAEFLFDRYDRYSRLCKEYLIRQNPKSPEMKDADYERTMKARAFDVARYWLFNGILTNVGQITSARVLERQIARLGASRYQASRDLAQLMKKACQERPFCPEGKDELPVAPTLMKYADPSEYLIGLREFLTGLTDRVAIKPRESDRYVDLVKPPTKLDEILATLLYEVTPISYARLLEQVADWSWDIKEGVIREIMERRGPHDGHHRAFAAGMPYQFDILMDIGGRRDLHRHRNCIQVHQPLSLLNGFETPALIDEMGLGDEYRADMKKVGLWIGNMARRMEEPQDADYLIPFGFMSGTIYKMHLSEALYIAELRSGVKGHFSYRDVACRIDQLIRDEEVFLEGMTRVTPLSEVDLLNR